jgi:SNF2 family DNA or RNA helicase
LEILGISDIFAAFARKNLDRTTMEIKNPKFNYRQPASKKNPKLIEVPLTDRGAFEYYFCDAKFDRFDIWQNKGSAHVKELHRLLVDTGMIRRRKSDVMHPLPPLGENVVKVDLSDDDWDLYDEVYDEFRDWSVDEAKRVAREEGISPDDAVRQVLRKLANGEGVMRLTKVRQVLATGKIPGTVEWIHKFMDGSLTIRHADGHKGPVSDDPNRRKLILFVHHQEPRKLLIEHPELQQYGILTILPGQEQTGDSIQQHKRLFQSDDRHRLIICSMAAREGHTLTAAKDVYLHEIPFVPSWVVQMAGRCWARLSEDFEPHEATVHYAVTDQTEDTRLLQMNRIKKATFNAVIDGEGQDDSIKEIREEDIETLVRAFALGSKQIGVAA